MGETFAISVLFGISKREGISQEQAFGVAAAIIAALGLPIFCLVRDTNINICRKKKEKEKELEQELLLPPT